MRDDQKVRESLWFSGTDKEVFFGKFRDNFCCFSIKTCCV